MQNGIEVKLRNKLEEIAKLPEGSVIPEDMKIKVAVLADSPTVVTGFGNVCREVLGTLYRTGVYSFDVVGINHDGSPHGLPYRIWPAVNPLIPDASYREVFGRQQFLDRVGSGMYDIVWILQDSFIVGSSHFAERIAETNDALPAHNKFTFIYYYPIDATPKKDWIDGSVRVADLPVVYTRYGYDETMKIYHVGDDSLLSEDEKAEHSKGYEEIEKKLNVIYHGVNTKDFQPLEADTIKDLRNQMWGVHKDKFVFANVNRNQPRKDIFRTMLAFKKLLDSRRAKGKDDVYLYLHCSIFDTGLNLIDMSKQIGLVEGDEWAYPDPKAFGPSKGMPVEMVNAVYNASDAVVTTTLGEGWGLSITEAMATKRPVLAPAHTSIVEILGRVGGADTELRGERGILVRTGAPFVQHDDNSRVRYITDVDDLAAKMEHLVENREAYQPMVERAFQWVNELKWEGKMVGEKWTALFASAYGMALAKREIAMRDEQQKIAAAEEPKWMKEKVRREKNRKK